MKEMKKRWACLLAMSVAGVASAGVIVPDLDDSSAFYDSTTAGTATLGGQTLANGITLAAQVTATAADITASQAGAVNVIEIGGTAKGSAILIKDGNFIFVTKNDANSAAPVMDETDGANHMIGITLGAVTADLDTQVWASFDGENGVVRYSLNGAANEVSLSNTAGWNWVGNNTLSLGMLDTAAGFYAGCADYGDYAAAPYPEDNFSSFLASNFAGTVTQGQYFNDVSNIPEPATMGLLGLAGAGMVFMRRRFKK